MLPFNSIARMSPLRLAMAAGGRVNFADGGLNYPNYYNITTPPVEVTAPTPTEAEKAAFFASHDSEGNPLQRLAGEGLSLANFMASVPNFVYSTAGSTMDYANQAASDLMHGRRPTPNWDLAREHAASAARPLALPSVGISALADKLGITPEYEQSATNRIMGKVGEGIDYTAQTLQDKYGIPAGGTKTLADTLMITGVPGAKPLARATVAGVKRGAENLSVPSTVGKQVGAIFPAGAPKRMVSKQVDLEGRAHPDEDVWPRFRGVHGTGPAGMATEYIEMLPEQLGIRQRDVQAAWEAFKKDKAYEMYPDAPDRTSAMRAYQLATPTTESRRAKQNEWLEEFSNTKPLGMPTLAELKVNEDKAVKALETTYPNMVAKYLGQENADPTVLLAAKDLPLSENVPELMRGHANLRQEQLAEIRTARTAAGLPPEGRMQEKLNKIIEGIVGVDTQLADLTATKWDMERQWDRDNQPAPEGYVELTRQETKLTNQKKILERQAREMETAPAIEAFHDLAVVKSLSPSEMKDSMEYPQTQFHPYLARKKDPATGKPIATFDVNPDTGVITPSLVTPESARIVQPRAGFLRASGLEDVMKDYAMDLYLGKTNKSPEQYMLQKAQGFKKVRDDKAVAEAKRAELTKANYMGYINAAPADKIYGNYAAIEFDPSMSAEELGKGLSIDTDVLNHCVGSGGMENGKHFGIWDPATGLKREGIRSPISNEIGQIMQEGVHVTSIRDTQTGKPVVTVKMVPDGSTGLYRLSYVNGEKNGVMDYKGAPALKDYLNSKADVISKPGSELEKNGVYDLHSQDNISRGARAANTSAGVVEDFIRMNPDTPRFATKDDIIAMKPLAVTTSPATPESVPALWEARNNIDLDRELVENPEGYEEAQRTRHDLAVRVFQQVRGHDYHPRPNSETDTHRLLSTWDNLVYANRHIPGIEAILPDLIQNNPSHFGLRNWQNHEIDLLADLGRGAEQTVPQEIFPDNRGGRRAILTHADAQDIVANFGSSIEEVNDVLDQLRLHGAGRGTWVDRMTPDEVQEMATEANRNLSGQVETRIADALANPNRSVERLIQLRDQLQNPPTTGPLRHTDPTYLEDSINDLDQAIIEMRANDWEPEAPVTLPAPEPTIDVLVDEYAALPESHTSHARAEVIRGQIINNVPAVNPMSPTISDLGAMELIGATTGIRPSELLASAVIRNRTHLGMGSWSIGRRTQLQNFINQHVENQADNVQAQQLEVIGAPAYITPRITAYLDRLEADLPTLTEQQFGERVSRIYARAAEQDVTQPQYAALNDRVLALQERVTGREPNVPAQIEAARAETVPHPQQPLVEAVLQSIGQADTLELLQRQNDFIGEHARTFSPEQIDAMDQAVTRRIRELRDAPMQLTGLAPIPEAVQTHLAEMGTWTDEGLRRNIRNLEERHPQTVYRDLTDSQAARVLSELNDEVDRRGAGFAKGGRVKAYGTRQTGEAKASGALGEIRMPNGRDVMTEYSINVDDMEMPSIIEGMHPADINYIRETGKVPEDAIATAIHSAHKRRAEGKSPFWNEDDSNYAQGGLVEHEQLFNDIIGVMHGTR